MLAQYFFNVSYAKLFAFVCGWKVYYGSVLLQPVIWITVMVVVMRLAEVVKYGGNLKNAICSDTTSADAVNHDVMMDEDDDVTKERRLVSEAVKAGVDEDDVSTLFLS